MAAYPIEPAHPPFPTAWYFPFHPDAGSHTSTLMSESDVGVIVAATRQNAGSVRNPCPPLPSPPPAAGGENPPAATDCAIVMDVSGSVSADKLSHGAAANASLDNETATHTAHSAHVSSFMASPPGT